MAWVLGWAAASGCGKSTKGPGPVAAAGAPGAAGDSAGPGAAGQGAGQGGASVGCAGGCSSAASDGCCPAECDAATDVDCRATAGSACGQDAECQTGLCLDGYCCATPCEVCQQCTGPNGSCAAVPARTEDLSPDAAGCSGQHWCDGQGACVPQVQVVAGGNTCALLPEGKVRCWGGRFLGYGNTVVIGDDEAPKAAGNIDVGGAVVQVATGGGHTCALLSTGGVRCWGYNAVRQLGIPGTETIGDDEVPASSPELALGAPAVQVATRGSHACALFEDGRASCWGYGTYGQLGFALVSPEVFEGSPPGLADIGEPAVELSVGWMHTCALLLGGQVRCWGYNGEKQLGYPNLSEGSDANDSPASLGNVPLGAEVQQVAAGGNLTCALLVGGGVRCWGWEQGADALTDNLNLGGRVKQIAVGGGHACALLSEGNVRCWGRGAYGRLGYVNEDDVRRDQLPPPLGDVDVGGRVVHLAAGDEHTCALLEDGNIRCWGLNDQGQLGYGHTHNIGDDETPASAGDVPYR